MNLCYKKLSVVLSSLFLFCIGHAGPIHKAAHKGDYKKVSTLLKKNKTHVNLKTKTGATTLHHAVFGEHPRIVTKLLKRGASVNAQTYQGNTPLHYASTRQIASLLIQAGAHTTIQNYHGQTPLDVAIEENYESVQKLLTAETQDRQY